MRELRLTDVEIVLIVIFALIALATPFMASLNSGNANDATAGTVVEVEDLSQIAKLASHELYDVGFWRQSGNLHRVGSAAVSREVAVKEIKSALRRAKIADVRVEVNTTTELTVWRAIYHGRGPQEGKRLGGATIKKVLGT